MFTGESWIRFTGTGGTSVPENVPLNYSCGGEAPGWIRGAHPAVADGVVQRQLCFHFNGNKCHYMYNITIRNCGTFYVYKPSNITECFLRVCTGKCACPLHNISKAPLSTWFSNRVYSGCFFCWKGGREKKERK